MIIFLTFFQIILFPLAIFIISFLVNKFIAKPDSNLYKVTAATNFAVSSYILGTFLLLLLRFVSKSIKIDGATYLAVNELIAYASWIISFIIRIPLVIGFCAYIFYFKKVKCKNIIKDAIIIGIYQIPLRWIFEIAIYVHWWKTIPTISDYFSVNYPWITIVWLIGAIIPLILAIILKYKRNKKITAEENLGKKSSGKTGKTL